MKRKNQKEVVTTRSSIIHGHKVVVAYFEKKLDILQKTLRKAEERGENTSEIQEKINYARANIDFHEEEISRHSLAAYVCGDPAVVVR